MTLPRTRSSLLSAALLLAASFNLPVQAAPGDPLHYGSGTGLQAGSAAWPRWQGRLGLATLATESATHHQPLSNGPAVGFGLSLLGDYYFMAHDSADRRLDGGFRASGGLILGDRTAAWTPLPGGLTSRSQSFSATRRSLVSTLPVRSDDPDANGHPATYLGIGYTGLGGLTATGAGWGFSADLGVLALRPRSVVRLGQQSLADTLRALDLAPTLQLGVSYSF